MKVRINHMTTIVQSFDLAIVQSLDLVIIIAIYIIILDPDYR